DNGIGAQTRFHYARSTNTDTVSLTDHGYAQSWSDFIAPSAPIKSWVVRATEVDVAGQTRITVYKYFDPIVAPDNVALAADGTAVPGPGRRFRGFQGVQKTLPLVSGESFSPVVFERYSYLKDADGAMDYRTLKEYEPTLQAMVKRTVDRTSYRSEPY